MTSKARIGRRTLLLSSVLGLVGACGGRAPVPPPPQQQTRAEKVAAPAPVEEPPVPAVPPFRVGFCGAPGSPALGRMTGDLDAAGAQLQQQLGAYPGKPQPVVELIATAVQSSPGADGLYRTRSADSTVQQYLGQARRLDGLLLLNIQPGHADCLDEVRAYEHWLTQPDVGIALDPEWAVDPGVKPGQEYGHVDGAKLDAIAAYLSDLVARHSLPVKMLAYHQVAASVVRSEGDLRPHPGVYAVKIVDGIGGREAKTSTWNVVMKTKPAHVATGFKLFYDEDTRDGSPLMRPDEVMALTPAPAYVVYE